MSNKVLHYVDLTLDSPGAYWAQIVSPSVVEYRRTRGMREALAAATFTWHLNEWVWHHRNPGIDTHDPKAKEWRNAQLQACPELGYLRDMTDATKHCGLGRMTKVRGAEPQVVRYASLPLLLNTENVLEVFLVLNDGSRVIFNTALQAAVEHWAVKLGFPLPPHVDGPQAP